MDIPWESEISGPYFMLWWMLEVLKRILHLKQTEKSERKPIEEYLKVHYPKVLIKGKQYIQM